MGWWVLYFQTTQELCFFMFHPKNYHPISKRKQRSNWTMIQVYSYFWDGWQLRTRSAWCSRKWFVKIKRRYLLLEPCPRACDLLESEGEAFGTAFAKSIMLIFVRLACAAVLYFFGFYLIFPWVFCSTFRGGFAWGTSLWRGNTATCKAMT